MKARHYSSELLVIYLTNLFGDVPVIISTDYRINSTIPKSSKANVYSQIIKDLLAAQEKLTEAYITNTERIRPNKFTASALLARVYLYIGDWTNSAAQATSIIDNGIYKLVELPNVFKKNSTETIWQMRPVDPNINTQEGYFFILESDPALNPETENAMTSGFMDSFEDLDERRDSWISSYADTLGNVWYYPFKYKIKSGSIPLSEYSTVFRLAEMYLIRSEARAKLGDTENAVADLDSIRSRAGLLFIEPDHPRHWARRFIGCHREGAAYGTICRMGAPLVRFETNKQCRCCFRQCKIAMAGL